MRSEAGKNLWQQDIKKSEYALGFIRTTGIILAMSYVFYGTFTAAPFFIPVWIFYMRDWMSDVSKKKEQEFRGQFRDSIQAMAGILKAGYSVENAIREAGKDIAPMYGKDTRIRREYDRMTHQLDMKVPAVIVLEEFSKRTGQEDVENFVNVFAAAKKSGGDSIAVIRDTVKLISEKIDTEKEIETLLASQKLEFDIMCAVPFAIILYMQMTFGEFLSVLYDNAAGSMVMTVCLAIYLGAYWLGRRIVCIEV